MESDSASYPEWKIVFPPHHPKEFPGLSNIDAFVVPEVFSLLSTILKVQFCPKKKIITLQVFVRVEFFDKCWRFGTVYVFLECCLSKNLSMTEEEKEKKKSHVTC